MLAVVVIVKVSLLEQHEGMALFEYIEHVESYSVLNDDFWQLDPANAADRTSRRAYLFIVSILSVLCLNSLFEAREVDVSGSALTGAWSYQVADNIGLEAIPALVLLFLVRTVSISSLVVKDQQLSLGLHLFFSLGYFAYLFYLKLFLSHL